MAKEMTIEQIQALMDSMHKNEISELVYEVEEFRLKIKGQQAPSIAPAPAPAAAVQAARFQYDKDSPQHRTDCRSRQHRVCNIPAGHARKRLISNHSKQRRQNAA